MRVPTAATLVCVALLASAGAGPARAESEVEELRTLVRELQKHQQATDAELDELRAQLAGEVAPDGTPAPAPQGEIELGELASSREGSFLERIDFHGHLAAEYVGIAKPSAGGVDPDVDVDGELLPRSSFTASDLTFFVGLPIYESLYAATEVEYESGGDEITLDQAFVQWDLIGEEGLSVRGGKFYFPFGIDRFYQNAPTNPLVDRPAPFLFVIPSTYSETGIEILGEVPLLHSPELVGEYEMALVNGLGEPAFRSVRDARQDRDNNSAKAWGGRLGLAWDRWLRLGVSGLTGEYDDGDENSLWAVGADLRADWGAFGLRSEWTYSRVQNPEAVDANGVACPELPCPGLTPPFTPLSPGFRRRGWYVESTWQPPWEILHLAEPPEYVLRYDVLDDDQNALHSALDGQRIAAGVVLRPYPHFLLKLQYEITDDEGGEVDNNGFLFQGAVDW
jgi:hypothetical protein